MWISFSLPEGGQAVTLTAAIGLVGLSHLDHAHFQRGQKIRFAKILSISQIQRILHRLPGHFPIETHKQRYNLRGSFRSMESQGRLAPFDDYRCCFSFGSHYDETGFYCEIRMNRIDHDTEAAVRRFLASIASRYDISAAIIYGSRARGTHRPDSDADVAVLLRGEHHRFLTAKLDMADVAFDVLLETGVLISPLPIWLDEWEHPENYSNPALLRNINREGIRL